MKNYKTPWKSFFGKSETFLGTFGRYSAAQWNCTFRPTVKKMISLFNSSSKTIIIFKVNLSNVTLIVGNVEVYDIFIRANDQWCSKLKLLSSHVYFFVALKIGKKSMKNLREFTGNWLDGFSITATLLTVTDFRWYFAWMHEEFLLILA